GKFNAIPNLVKLGLSLEQIAQGLELPIETVRKATDPQVILAAFVRLLKEHSEVFSSEQLEELTQLLTSVADNEQEIASNISTWLKRYAEVNQAYQDIFIAVCKVRGEEATSVINKKTLQAEILNK
ncbi:MAG: hypothetical protein F6K24_56880, partial [Okeania sp. SIO2D1]|nr:hypothetical protein [Okeania sp. SIO2D1]